MEIGGGGIGRTAYHQVKPLLELGVLEEIWSPSIKNLPTSMWNKVPEITDKGYEVSDIHFDGYVSLNMEPTDMIHSWASHCLFTFQNNKDAIKIVNLYSAHPVVQARYLKDEPVNTAHPVLIKKMQKELEMADHIVIPSEFIYNSLKEFDLEEKAKIIPFGVNNEIFTPRTEDREDDKFRVIFVGTNWARKGLIYLLAAWDKLNLGDKGELIVAGVNPHVQKFLELEGKDNIKFGWIPDLTKAYQQSDIFVLPAVEDGCPLATYEAMACGLPVIISSNTGTYQHVMHGENGFIVPPRDGQAIYDLLLQFVKNREHLEYMGNKARASVENWTWERHENEYKKWIEQLCN